MTTTPHGQVPEALRLAALLDAEKWTGSMTLVSYARACVAELRRLHVENEALRAKQSNKSFAQLYPPNPDATCKCEHWQYCAECHPTAPQQGATEPTQGMLEHG